MDNEELIAIIKAHRGNALGVEDGDLSIERAQAMNHYHGRPYGNEVEGRSAVVSRDLAEAVDWVIPAVMKVFTQSGRLAEFDPQGPEDEALAQQESDYVNQVLMRDNHGFMVLHDAIKDTLLLKNGYVKHWWEVEEKVEESKYTGLTMDQIAMMQKQVEGAGGTFEVTGQESYFMGELPPLDPMTGQPLGPMPLELFDIKAKTTRKDGKLMWQAVPAEEVRVSKKCRGSLQESPFTEHVTRKTRSDLREMGMSADFVQGLPSFGDSKTSQQSFARDSVTDESDNYGPSSGDRSMDEIEYCEAYIRVDHDGDGIAELRRVVTCADEIPPGDEWNEPIAAVPMTGFVAKRVPHRHVGESLDDELADLQEILTTLKRQLLDNMYRVNNAETAINEDANLKDFLTTTPGGVKRIKGSGPVQNAFASITTTPIIGQILPVIDYIENSKESRTGISKATTGLDPDVLQNTTKGAFMENLNKASQKTEMIIRMLAESGVKESVLQAHAILMRHQDQARTVQLRGKWVPVNPQDWRTRTDLTVRVGLGTGSEDEKRGKMQLLATLQAPLMQALPMAPPPVYEKMYALFADVAETMGFDAPEKYAITPHGPEHQKVYQMAQEAAKAQAQGGSSSDLSKAAQIQAEANMRVQSERNHANMQVKAAEDAFKREKAMLEARMDAQDAEAQRRHEVMLQQMQLASDEAREAMKQEVQLMIKSMPRDLGQPGLSAGVQGSPGWPVDQGIVTHGMTMEGAPMMGAEMPTEGAETAPAAPAAPDVAGALTASVDALREVVSHLGKPRKIVRGPDGRAEGLE